MGMFDYINCKFPLPEVDLKGTTLTLSEMSSDNQTKDLENLLQNYTIEEDGRISYTYYKTRTWVTPNKKTEGILSNLGYLEETDPETRYLTGNHVIKFGNLLHKDLDKYDYSWDFEALVQEGVVKEIKLLEFKKIPNEERKKLSAKIREKLKQGERFRKTLRYKYFFKYLYIIKYTFKRNIIRVLNAALNYMYKI